MLHLSLLVLKLKANTYLMLAYDKMVPLSKLTFMKHTRLDIYLSFLVFCIDVNMWPRSSLLPTLVNRKLAKNILCTEPIAHFSHFKGLQVHLLYLKAYWPFCFCLVHWYELSFQFCYHHKGTSKASHL